MHPHPPRAITAFTGDMLRDPQAVYATAEEVAEAWRQVRRWRIDVGRGGAACARP